MLKLFSNTLLVALAIAPFSVTAPCRAANDGSTKPTVFAEKAGLVVAEAEHFFEQTATDKRAFYLTTKGLTAEGRTERERTEEASQPKITPDGDPNHVAGASNGAYLEILPDTRRTHADKLIRGTNFAPEAGKMAVLSYKVNITTPGRYYVWVRAFSTGSEDNGLHVGIDGTWPESGQRLQWCEGKRSWRWDSKQRTEKNHCGEAGKIFLDIDQPGEHTVHFSMREDGFEFDKWLMTTDAAFKRPAGVGPTPVVASGPKPAAYAFVEPPQPTATSQPRGQQPTAPKPTVRKSTAAKSLLMPAKMFAESQPEGYYLDRGKWMAINPEKNKTAFVERTCPFPTGKYHLVLRAVGENDGKSTYEVTVDGESIGVHTCPLASDTYAEGAKYHKRFENIEITDGTVIGVRSTIASEDGSEFSRARWSGIAFVPADKATAVAAAPMLRQELAVKAPQPDRRDRSTSPTKNVSDQPLIEPREANGNGSVLISGELKQWHKVTLDLAGPYAHEQDNEPNPFTDYAMGVTFVSPSGKMWTVPGYFAADGDAANSGAESGTVWRAHFAPNEVGTWEYIVGFEAGEHVALNIEVGETEGNRKVMPVVPYDGVRGSFTVTPTDKTGRDLRAHGRLQYVGKHYPQFAGTKEYFLKAGADAPETLLGYADFDGTVAGNPRKAPLKTWSPHIRDWNEGDPTWAGGKGKGLVGAINYLSGKGCNAFSFLTYNAGGDGDNVWPFIQREDKLHYDCSKLDQWGIVFDHGTQRGMYLHFKMQETEMDDHNKGTKGNQGFVPECLDGGNLGPQRKLYCRELIARFGHNLALNWNLGEENTQSVAQQQAMVDYIKAVDPYDHHIVIHTFPSQQEKVYKALLGDRSNITGVSLQNSSLKKTHADTLKWVQASAEAGKPWIVAFDESGSASYAQVPDLGYKGFDGTDKGKFIHTQHEVRKYTLWGTLMAGGVGNEYYFGYKFAENDIVCEDWRSRDQSWGYCRIALEFFHRHDIPFWDMKNADELVGNASHDDSKYCFAKMGEVYLVYLPDGGSSMLDLSDVTGEYTVEWFNPRTGGPFQSGTRETITGGSDLTIGSTPASEAGEDWLAVIRKR